MGEERRKMQREARGNGKCVGRQDEDRLHGRDQGLVGMDWTMLKTYRS